MNNGVNQAMATIKSVAKKSTKVVIAALPITTVIGNGLDVWAQTGTIEAAIPRFLQRYTGFNIALPDATFNFSEFMKGTGSLVITSILAGVLKGVV